MKKIFSMILVIAMVVSFSACGGSSSVSIDAPENSGEITVLLKDKTTETLTIQEMLDKEDNNPASYSETYEDCDCVSKAQVWRIGGDTYFEIAPKVFENKQYGVVAQGGTIYVYADKSEIAKINPMDTIIIRGKIGESGVTISKATIEKVE